MDLDLAQLRAFVAAAEHRHVGDAAVELLVSQQAISKRIMRLEQAVGEALFTRLPRGVELTEPGRRLLPYARQLLVTADAALTAVRQSQRVLRVDVWSHVQDPLRMLRRLGRDAPELLVATSMRRNLTASLHALQRGDVDAAFGRVHDLDGGWPPELDRRLVLLGRFAAAVGHAHPLAGATVLRPGDMRAHGVRLAAEDGPAELVGWFRRFASHFDIPFVVEGRHLSDEVLDGVPSDPGWIGVLPADGPLPPGATVRRIPIDPTPCYPWSLVWRTGDPHPLLALLLRRIADTQPAEDWVGYRPGRDWLPALDLVDLHEAIGDVSG